MGKSFTFRFQNIRVRQSSNRKEKRNLKNQFHYKAVVMLPHCTLKSESEQRHYRKLFLCVLQRVKFINLLTKAKKI